MHSQTTRTRAQTVRRAAATMLLLGAAAFVQTATLAAHPGTPAAKAGRTLSSAAPPLAQTDFAAMVERYGPAVVNISTATAGAPGDQSDQQATASGSAPALDSLDPDDPLFALARTAGGQSQGQPAAQSGLANAPRILWGTGSGFIVSADGVIVTTAHVVNRAEQVTVTLTDKRQFKADVLGVDPQTDVALLQIEHATKLPVVRLGDSSRMRVGERVLAIGAPDGPQNAAASGLVSVTPHTMADGNTFSFIETDIAPEPDNSGGPVLDGNGTVIGIAVQIYSDNGRYRNLTLAIPIEAAVRLRAQLQGQGKLASGSLGVRVQDVDPGLAAAFGLPHEMGALVTDVSPGARGAAAGGLKPGDVITQINGKAIQHQGDLTDYVVALQPGTKVALTIVRNKKPMTLTTTVVAARADTAPSSGVPDAGTLARLGLSVHGLSESERRAAELPSGVAVDAVTGAAANAGIQPGDIILSVNSEPVTTPEALDRAITRGGKEVALLIQRDDSRNFVSLTVR